MGDMGGVLSNGHQGYIQPSCGNRAADPGTFRSGPPEDRRARPTRGFGCASPSVHGAQPNSHDTGDGPKVGNLLASSREIDGTHAEARNASGGYGPAKASTICVPSLPDDSKSGNGILSSEGCCESSASGGNGTLSL